MGVGGRQGLCEEGGRALREWVAAGRLTASGEAGRTRHLGVCRLRE